MLAPLLDDFETFTVALPLNPSNDAVTLVAGPAPTAIAKPVALTVTTFVFPEDHEDDDVTLPVDPFAYVAVAVNCCVPPTRRFTDAGVTASAVTGTVVNAADPLIP